MEIAGEHMGGAILVGKAGILIYVRFWGYSSSPLPPSPPRHRIYIVGLYDIRVCRLKRGVMSL